MMAIQCHPASRGDHWCRVDHDTTISDHKMQFRTPQPRSRHYHEHMVLLRVTSEYHSCPKAMTCEEIGEDWCTRSEAWDAEPKYWNTRPLHSNFPCCRRSLGTAVASFTNMELNLLRMSPP